MAKEEEEGYGKEKEKVGLGERKRRKIKTSIWVGKSVGKYSRKENEK